MCYGLLMLKLNMDVLGYMTCGSEDCSQGLLFHVLKSHDVFMVEVCMLNCDM